MAFARSAGTLLAILWMAFSACAPTPPPSPPVLPGAQKIPGPKYRVTDSIDAIDFSTEADSILHVIWLATTQQSNSKAKVREVWYQRGDLTSGRWGEPSRVTATDSRQLRILHHDGILHVLVGGKLGHSASKDGGKSWAEQTTHLPPGITYVPQFDARVANGTLLVGYLTQVRRNGRDTVRVFFARFPGAASQRQLAVNAGVAQCSPRLIAKGDTLYLLYGLREEMYSNANTQTRAGQGRQIGRLFLLRSLDFGTTWSRAEEVGPLSTPGAKVAGEDRPGEIAALELAVLPDREIAFFNTSMLYYTESKLGGGWSPSRVLAGFSDSTNFGYWTSSVSAAPVGATGYVAWIDSRFRKTDRTPLNPLGGIPWSDQPDWKNNDVSLSNWLR